MEEDRHQDLNPGMGVGSEGTGMEPGALFLLAHGKKVGEP